MAQATFAQKAAKTTLFGGLVGGTFSLGGDFARRSGEDSRTVQSDLLVGTLTARVVGVDPAGNLLVEGERHHHRSRNLGYSMIMIMIISNDYDYDY